MEPAFNRKIGSKGRPNGGSLMPSPANKRIPVTEERWRELHDLKGPGETYDELLEQLIQEHNRRQLVARAREVRDADSEELTSLDSL